MLKHFKVGACRNIKLRKNYFIKTDFMTSYLRLAAKIRLHILSLECSMYQERCQKIVVGYNHFERPAKQMSYFFTILNPLLFSGVAKTRVRVTPRVRVRVRVRVGVGVRVRVGVRIG